ncbi:MAG TPA: transcriptional repressor [Dehalococcoidia bacterium]|nr:transcriptional repressor [Dehalococcoidia bacterium]
MSCSVILKEKGLRLTPQRRLIVDIIHQDDAHLTAEEIISSVQSKMPGVNKSTIYRTLEMLEELNCVFKSEVDDKFIYHHAEEGHHHHIICRKCGKSIDCDEHIFHPVETALSRKYGFHADFKHVIITGLCSDCL